MNLLTIAYNVEINHLVDTIDVRPEDITIRDAVAIIKNSYRGDTLRTIHDLLVFYKGSEERIVSWAQSAARSMPYNPDVPFYRYNTEYRKLTNLYTWAVNSYGGSAAKFFESIGTNVRIRGTVFDAFEIKAKIYVRENRRDGLLTVNFGCGGHLNNFLVKNDEDLKIMHENSKNGSFPVHVVPGDGVYFKGHRFESPTLLDVEETHPINRSEIYLSVFHAKALLDLRDYWFTMF